MRQSAIGSYTKRLQAALKTFLPVVPRCSCTTTTRAPCFACRTDAGRTIRVLVWSTYLLLSRRIDPETSPGYYQPRPGHRTGAGCGSASLSVPRRVLSCTERITEPQSSHHRHGPEVPGFSPPIVDNFAFSGSTANKGHYVKLARAVTF